MSSKIYNCSLCLYNTDIKFNFNRHMVLKHTNNKDKNVDIEGKNTGINCTNTGIEGKNTGIKCKNTGTDSKCVKCNKILSSKQYLNNHLLNCNGVSNPLECHLCHKILANRGSKSSHLKICKNKPIELINQIIMTINYKCSKCSFQSNKRIDIYNHINIVHRENIRIKKIN